MGNSDRLGGQGGAGWRLAALALAAGYVLAVAFVPEFCSWSPLSCTTRRTLGLHCPTCGLTRSFACLVRLDPLSAVAFNPLVIFAAPFAAVLAIDGALAVAGRRRAAVRLPPVARRWGSAVFLTLLVAVFVALFIVRTASWLMPAWNPDGWLLPPAEFPPAPAVRR